MPKFYTPQNVVKGSESAGNILASAGNRDIQIEANRQSQLTQLASQREMQQRQLDAQFLLQKQSSDDAFRKIAIEHGFQKELKDIDLRNQDEQIKQRAASEAKLWDYKFTAKQKLQLAQRDQARDAIATNPAMTQEEKSMAMTLVEAQFSGVEQPHKVVRHEQPLPEWITEPTGVNVDPKTGAAFTIGMRNGVRTLSPVNPKFTKEGMEQERQREMDKLAADFLFSDVKDTLNGKQFSRDPKSTDFKRRMNIIKAWKKAQSGEPIEDISTQPEKPKKQKSKAPKEVNWWDQYEKQGNYQIPQVYKEMEPQVGYARFVFESIASGKYGTQVEQMPPEVKKAFLWSVGVLQSSGIGKGANQ